MEISEIQAKLNELNPKLEHFRRSL
ncbi:hypothetical protein LBGG_02002 [Lactobacillus gasseri MV-22]|nr:hypothetical protein LBGG_02002 [Lactobacillus gasseri MV-22]